MSGFGSEPAVSVGRNDLHFTRDSFAEGFLPGNSLRYGRLAFERLVKDQLTELADPDARQKFQRAERKAKKEFGQGTWWRRGNVTPDREPGIGAAFGE